MSTSETIADESAETVAIGLDASNAYKILHANGIRAFAAAKSGKFEKAAKTFEEIAQASKLYIFARFDYPRHVMRAILCHMASGDLKNAKDCLDRFPDFVDVRERNLVNQIIKACESKDVESLTSALVRYELNQVLDANEVVILLKIKDAFFYML